MNIQEANTTDTIYRIYFPTQKPEDIFSGTILDRERDNNSSTSQDREGNLFNDVFIQRRLPLRASFSPGTEDKVLVEDPEAEPTSSMSNEKTNHDGGSIPEK